MPPQDWQNLNLVVSLNALLSTTNHLFLQFLLPVHLLVLWEAFEIGFSTASLVALILTKPNFQTNDIPVFRRLNP